MIFSDRVLAYLGICVFFYNYWGRSCVGIQNDSCTYFKVYSLSNTVVLCAFGAVTGCLSQTTTVVKISQFDGE